MCNTNQKPKRQIKQYNMYNGKYTLIVNVITLKTLFMI